MVWGSRTCCGTNKETFKISNFYVNNFLRLILKTWCWRFNLKLSGLKLIVFEPFLSDLVQTVTWRTTRTDLSYLWVCFQERCWRYLETIEPCSGLKQPGTVLSITLFFWTVLLHQEKLSILPSQHISRYSLDFIWNNLSLSDGINKKLKKSKDNDAKFYLFYLKSKIKTLFCQFQDVTICFYFTLVS